MNLSLIALLCLAVSAQRSQVAGNYEGMKEFLQGFMTEFYSGNFTLPSDCMAPTFQSKLDSDLVAYFKMIITGHLQEAVAYFSILSDDWSILAQDCNVTAVELLIETEYHKKGVWPLLFNFSLNLIDIIPRLTECLGLLMTGDDLKAGGDLGVVFRRVFKPQ